MTAVTRTLLFPEILQLLIVTGREAAETEAGAKPVPIKTVQSRRISSCFTESEAKMEKDIADGEPEGMLIKSPLVGTFYAAPAEDADPFVSVGDQVKKGQTLAIVEAMKLMNEIESDFDGKVAEIYVENGQAVEYGQPLFRIA